MKETLNKYKFTILAILILFFIKSCVDKQIDEVHGQNKTLKEQVKKAQDSIKVVEAKRLKLKDSIKTENIKKEQELKILFDRIKNSENKIKILQLNNQKSKESIKNLSLISIAKELNVIYGSSDATAKEKYIAVSGSMPHQILETVVDANYCQDLVRQKYTQLNIKDSIISIKDSQLENSSLLLLSAEKTIEKQKDLSTSQEQLNKNLEKEVRKLRTKNTLNKLLIPISIIGGGYLGYKLAK